MTTTRHDRRGARAGLSLIEVIIGLAIVGVLVLSYGTSLTAAVAARRVKLRNLAAALADIELSALRTYSPSQVPVQTDGDPYGVLFSEGEWGVETDASAYSGTQSLHTDAPDAAGVSSAYPLPEDAYDDFTLTAQVKIDSASPASWQTGLFFRSRDLQNGYRVYLTSSSLVLERLIDGAVTTLYSDVRTVDADVWHELSVTTNGSSISVDLNGAPVTDQTDSAYSVGQAGLIAWDGTEARFDDVDMDGTVWDMDAETIGDVPDGWERFGLSDLPSGDMTLTSEDRYGDSGFKRYTATVTWNDGSGQKTLSQSTDVTD